MPRKRELDAVVPGEPSAVADRLQESTRWSPAPYRGGVFTLGDKPLKGRVAADGFNVGLNVRDWWTMLQPTARARLESVATGTRVAGEVGMSPWLVWMLRTVVVLFVPLVVGLSTSLLLAEGSANAALIAAAFAAFALVISVLGVGAHVHHANEQVEQLHAAVLAAAGGGPARAAALTEALREAGSTPAAAARETER